MHNVVSLPATSPCDDSEVTPAMSTDDESAFLVTPTQAGNISGISADFIFPSRSYDVQVDPFGVAGGRQTAKIFIAILKY